MDVWMISLFVIGSAFAIPLSTVAIHEQGACLPSSSIPDVGATGSVAVFVEEELLVETVSVWAYVESNGVLGFQRHDDAEVDQSCGHGADALVI